MAYKRRVVPHSDVTREKTACEIFELFRCCVKLSNRSHTLQARFVTAAKSLSHAKPLHDKCSSLYWAKLQPKLLSRYLGVLAVKVDDGSGNGSLLNLSLRILHANRAVMIHIHITQHFLSSYVFLTSNLLSARLDSWMRAVIIVNNSSRVQWSVRRSSSM